MENTNEIDRASAILAARSATDELQGMAEKAAKIEADTIMPILDSIRINFTPELAESFSTKASEALNTVLEALKEAKMVIGAEIDKMEAVMEGKPMPTDMDDDIDTDTGTDDVADAETEIDSEDLDDIFADAPSERDMKESVQMVKHVSSILKEGKDTTTAIAETSTKFKVKPARVLEALVEASQEESTLGK